MSPTRFPLADELSAHKLRVERLARDLSPSEHDAEDLAQEVWVAALRARNRRIDHFGGWTRAVTTRLAGKLAVRGRRRRDWELNAARPEGQASNLESIERRSLREYLEHRIGELNEPYSEVLRLRFLDELGTEEIAARLGRTGGTVRSQIKRGLELLRTRINGDLDAERGLRGVGLLALLARRSTQALLFGSVAVVAAAVFFWPSADPVPGVRAAAVERADEAPRPRGVVAPPVVRERLPSTAELPAVPSRPSVRGRVLDHQGDPVAGAEVWLAGPGSDPVLAAHAETDGTFALSDVDATSWIGARLDGKFPSPEFRLDSLLRDGEAELELVLPREVPGRLIVEVLDPEGQPVPDARVCIVPGYASESFLGPDLELRRRPRGARGATDANGLLESWKLGGRVSYVHVESAGHPPVIAKTRRAFLLPERVVVELPRPVSLAGGVRLPDGTPASGALLTLAHESGLAPVQLHAGGDGSFLFEGLTPGRYTLSVVGKGVASLVEEVTIGEAVADLELQLSEDFSIAGFALDETGAPLAGRRVTLATRATLTDADGRFVFGAVASGKHMARLHDEDDLGVAVAWVAACRRGDLTVQLVARAGVGALNGTLIGGDERTRLSLRAPQLEGELALAMNDLGAFSADGLPRGVYALVVRDPDVGASVLGELLLEPERTLELGQLALPAPGALELRLVVPAGIGDRIPQLSLRSELFRLQCRTRFEPEDPHGNGGGVLRVERLPPGTYDVSLTTPGFVDVFDTLEVAAGEPLTREIVLRAGVRRDFAIVAPSEIDALPALLLRGRDGTRRVYSDGVRRPDDREGLFLSLNLAPGDYTLAVDEDELEGELAFTVDGPIAKPAQNPLRLELGAR